MRSVYITADKITMDTGGGAATVNEIEALRSISNLELVLSRDNIAPELWKQPDSPFLYDYFALQKVAESGKHFDVAHLYSWTFTQTVRYLKEHGTKVCYHVPAHDRKTTVEEFQRLGMEYPFPHIKDDYIWEVYSRGYLLADVVTCQSEKSAGFMRSIGCKDVRVVPGGITWPTDVKPMPANFHVAYLGVVGPDKGLAYLIKGWEMLNYPDSKLILAGSGTETLEPYIRQLADRGHFQLMGRVANVADIYNACAVYIQPSCCESFALEIPEAMSYARVVIASEGAGASELIEDGVNGFVVPIRDPEAIAEKIRWCRDNASKLPEMGERARKKAEDYTWDKIRRLYIDVWTSMTGTEPR